MDWYVLANEKLNSFLDLEDTINEVLEKTPCDDDIPSGGIRYTIEGPMVSSPDVESIVLQREELREQIQRRLKHLRQAQAKYTQFMEGLPEDTRIKLVNRDRKSLKLFYDTFLAPSKEEKDMETKTRYEEMAETRRVNAEKRRRMAEERRLLQQQKQLVGC